MYSRTLSTLFALGTLTCSQAFAGTITGTVIDSQGNPVQNALFEIDEMSGSGPTSVIGGMTNAQGVFTTTITPDGNYAIRMYPQSPPQSLAVVTRFENVTVGPTVNNMGTITLPVGVWATGRVVNTVGTPLQSVGVQFVTAPDHQPLDFTNHDTNTLGQFSVTVPFGECEMQFEPGPVPYYGGPGAAPTSLSLNITAPGPINLGDIVMPQGAPVSATVLRQSDSSPIADLEIQWVNRATGKLMYVPHPRTDDFGNITFVSQLGNFDLRLAPDAGDGLMPQTVSNLSVPGAQPGNVFLVDGVELSGRVRGTNNADLANVSVTVVDHATQAEVFIGNVRTGVNGKYTAIVQNGTYDVRFSPPFSLPYAQDIKTNVVVSGDKTLNSNPAPLAFFTTSGVGSPGAGGITPLLTAVGGAPRVGNGSYSLKVSDGVGGAMAIAVLQQPWTTSIGTDFVTSSHGFRRLQLNGNFNVPGEGVGGFSLPIANDAGLIGQTLHARFMVRDPSVVRGWSSTVNLSATVQP